MIVTSTLLQLMQKGEAFPAELLIMALMFSQRQ
jgi:hypothetical protein